MKKTFLSILGVALFANFGFSQSFEEVQNYGMQLNCECGYSGYRDALPQSTRDFIAKIGPMSQTQTDQTIGALSYEERQSYLKSIMGSNGALHRDCDPIAIQSALKAKYPNAEAILKAGMPAQPTPDYMEKLLAKVPSCDYMLNMTKTMKALMNPNNTTAPTNRNKN